MDRIREHMVFHGRVQGVGFRYTARHAAERLGLTGWIENCWDGSVECEVQGTLQDVEEFLNALGDQRWIRIFELERRRIAPEEGERSFRVRGY